MTIGLLPDLSTALLSIEGVLRAALPDTVSVSHSGGAFDAGELRRQLTAAPAAIVSCLGVHSFTRFRGDGWQMEGNWAAYIVTRDQPPDVLRDIAALNLATDVLRILPKQLWGNGDGFILPDETTISAHNLYSGTVDAALIALWAVTWQQGIRLSALLSPTVT
jgi:hypothetical protein